MRYLVPKLIVFFALIIYTNALACTTCTNCHASTSNPKYECSIGQNFCYTVRVGDTIRAGCAAGCQEDANTTCCTANNCNSNVANKLICTQCDDCLNGGTIRNQTCEYKQGYCFTERYGNKLSTGCAEKCEEGPTKKCCSDSIVGTCNKIETLMCYKFNVTHYNASESSCTPEDNFCYSEQTGNTFRGGCAKECVETTNKQCCSFNKCNKLIRNFTCTTCTDCLYTVKVSSQNCTANQNFCQLDRYGTNDLTVDAGCVSTCKPGATCCNTNDCNTLPESLYCNACQNCSFNATTSIKCPKKNAFCYYEKNGVTGNAGCAASCTPDANTQCCSTKNCNTVPAPFTCIQCTNCSFTTPTRKVCGLNDKFCFTEENGKFVSAGCAETCQETANRKCCNTKDCNSKFPEPFQCYACPSCKYFAPVLRKCGYLDTFCYKETNSSGSFIEKGCASKCEETAYKKCCDSTGCNHSTKNIGLSFVSMLGLVLFQFLFRF